MKKLIITIDKDGSAVMETSGEVGKVCLKKLETIAKDSGQSIKSRQAKKEFYQKESHDNKSGLR